MTKDDVTISAVQHFEGPKSIRGPLYLLIIEGELKSKNLTYYLCTKIDKHPGYVDVICQQYFDSLDVISKKTDLFSLIDDQKLSEMAFYGNRIVSIQNLTYKKVKTK